MTVQCEINKNFLEFATLTLQIEKLVLSLHLV